MPKQSIAAEADEQDVIELLARLGAAVQVEQALAGCVETDVGEIAGSASRPNGTLAPTSAPTILATWGCSPAAMSWRRTPSGNSVIRWRPPIAVRTPVACGKRARSTLLRPGQRTSDSLLSRHRRRSR